MSKKSSEFVQKKDSRMDDILQIGVQALSMSNPINEPHRGESLIQETQDREINPISEKSYIYIVPML